MSIPSSPDDSLRGSRYLSNVKIPPIIGAVAKPMHQGDQKVIEHLKLQDLVAYPHIDHA
jgi:hypothetical protein